MKIRRDILAVSLLAAACGGDATGPAVETVTVSATTDQITVGETLKFSASAKDASGTAVAGQKVGWTSSDISIATVDTAGMVTGIAAGSVSVTALVAGVPGSAPLAILPNTCEGAITVELEAGQHAVYEPTDCLILPSGIILDRYRVALVRTMETGTEGNVVTGALKTTALGVTTAAAPQPASAPGAGFGRLGADVRRRIEVTARAHADLRDRERALGSGALAPSRPWLSPAYAPSANTVLFNVGTTCSSTDTASAVLVYENADVVFYQDIAQRGTTTVDSLAADSVARYYTQYGKPTIDAYFGPPSDIDGNGKLVVLTTPKVVGDTSGYVTSRDLQAKASCAGSNEMELIYFNADLIDSRHDTIDIYFALETVVHEAEHVTSLYQRASGGFHPTWIEEGRAEIAGEMASRRAWAAGAGPAPNQRATRNHLINDGRVNDRNFGVALMVLRSMWWVDSEPNGMPVTPEGADDGADVYASGWHFNRWLGDAYGAAGSAPYADSAFFRQVTASSTPQGILGLEAVTGQSYGTLVEEFITAIGTHRVAQDEPARSFSTYDFVSLTDDLWAEQPEGTYPFPVTGPDPVTFSTTTYSGPMGAGGFRMHDFVSNGTGVGLQLQTTLADPSSVIVVRIR